MLYINMLRIFFKIKKNPHRAIIVFDISMIDIDWLTINLALIMFLIDKIYIDTGWLIDRINAWMISWLISQVTYCIQSQEIIWGIAPQGYRCQNCDYDVHKKIVHQVHV